MFVCKNVCKLQDGFQGNLGERSMVNSGEETEPFKIGCFLTFLQISCRKQIKDLGKKKKKLTFTELI